MILVVDVVVAASPPPPVEEESVSLCRRGGKEANNDSVSVATARLRDIFLPSSFSLA